MKHKTKCDTDCNTKCKSYYLRPRKINFNDLKKCSRKKSNLNLNLNLKEKLPSPSTVPPPVPNSSKLKTVDSFNMDIIEMDEQSKKQPFPYKLRNRKKNI